MRYILLPILFSLFLISLAAADTLKDSDSDGVPDKDEIQIYNTDPHDPDTDDDGYNDWVELNNGYSPHQAGAIKLENSDFDKDGLTDRMELRFGTDITDPDTDGDGHPDGEEVNNGYDPLKEGEKKLPQRIEINTGGQKLSYFLGGVRMNTYAVSTGKPSMPTPKGHYMIVNKADRAWSPYGLWMPYWMGLGTGEFGIHQLPVWPNGYREGEEHLGQPVSHGCIRLGIEPAKRLYEVVDVGTPVFIY